MFDLFTRSLLLFSYSISCFFLVLFLYINYPQLSNKYQLPIIIYLVIFLFSLFCSYQVINDNVIYLYLHIIFLFVTKPLLALKIVKNIYFHNTNSQILWQNQFYPVKISVANSNSNLYIIFICIYIFNFF